LKAKSGEATGGSNAPPQFRILSLDGGGIRGAFTAACLAEIEKRLPRPVVDYFDLIAGTSTGGIIAVGLALGVPAERIEQFYHEYGGQIFRRRPPRRLSLWKRPFLGPLLWLADRRLRRFGLDWDQLVQSKYQAEKLKDALTEVFGERRLGEAQCRLVIPSIDLARGQTTVFKTSHLDELIYDLNLRAVDVVLATTCAPTYFPHATIKQGSAYADGGLWANNPSMVAYVEAMRIRERACRPGIDPTFGASDIGLLSIGTGTSNYSVLPPENGAGLAWWAPRLIDVISISQAQGIDFQTRHVLRERYRRVDFRLPDNSWSLDALAFLPRLIHFGHEAAKENLTQLKPLFFSKTAPRFVPFHEMQGAPQRDRGKPGE